MINLITGLPGNGKTLYSIGFIEQWAKKDNRPVFYSGIKLTEEGKTRLGWEEIDALQWFTAPPGAIVIIDEAQRIFRPRTHGKEVPKHVEQLETHRHQGIDLVLVTQHPMLIDNEVRRLAGSHRHIVRKFGAEGATVHEWTEVRQDCEKPGRRADSSKTPYVYDKSIYKLYVSAEVHTVKRKLPRQFWIAVGCAIAIAVILGLLVLYFSSKIDGAGNAKRQAESAGVSAGMMGSTGKKFDPEDDARQYVAMQTPRVAGLPHTAPKFDEITKPDTAPVPVACIATANRCQCYTQQGTRMPSVPDDVCRDTAEFGYFQEFDVAGRNRSQESLQQLERMPTLPLSGASTLDAPRPSQWSSFADLPGRGEDKRRVLGG